MRLIKKCSLEQIHFDQIKGSGIYNCVLANANFVEYYVGESNDSKI